MKIDYDIIEKKLIQYISERHHKVEKLEFRVNEFNGKQVYDCTVIYCDKEHGTNKFNISHNNIKNYVPIRVKKLRKIFKYK